MKLTAVCKECGKDAVPFLTVTDGVLLKCGHFRKNEEPVPTKSSLDYSNFDGSKSAYDFQRDALDFFVKADFNVLCADAMGVGKTIEALLALKNYPEKLLPAVVCPPAAITYNWARENMEWVFGKEDPLAYYIVQGKMPWIPKGFKVYIISMDSLATNMKWKVKTGKGIEAELTGPLFELGIKSIICDEVHKFKDDGSKRTRALINFVKGANIKHKIFLSGTPIKNSADELFVPLNLLDPIEYRSRDFFRRVYLEKDFKGRWSRLKEYRQESFYKKISKFYIRREKVDVLKDLPPFRRLKTFITVDDPWLKNSYNQELKVFSFKMQTEKMSSLDMLGMLARLRRITGMAKVQPATEWIEEFFESAELDKMLDPNYPDKLLVGIQHVDVRRTLKERFDARDAQMKGEKPPVNCLTLSGDDSSEKKLQIVDEFTSPRSRLLIANMLAGGEGLNIQACSNMLVLERQWNAANEEQFEARAWRDGQKYPVEASYMMATGTIDQWLDEMVDDKRNISQETNSVMTGRAFTPSSFNLERDPDAIRSLAERSIANPLQ